MDIRQIFEDKKQFLDLLLLADEQENMIDRYLERGDMFVLFEADRPVTVAVVTGESPDTCELKSLATDPEAQRRGHGRQMLAFLAARYRGRYRFMQLGTGDVPRILRFYRSCGFVPSHRVSHFFTEHYDEPMVEDGVLLDDMVYLKKEL